MWIVCVTVWSVFVACMKKLCILGYQNASSEEFDQTAQTSRLIWIFAVFKAKDTFSDVAAQSVECHIYRILKISKTKKKD